MRQQLLASGRRLLAREKTGGPAEEYAHPDYQGTLGLIAPYARNFCNSCSRLQVTPPKSAVAVLVWQRRS